MTTSPANQETVLLAVTGMSPAVLTETLWALANEPEPILPQRVIAVTTLAGRDCIASSLFAPAEHLGGVCPWDALRNALAGAGHDLNGKLRFGTTGDDIRVITGTRTQSGRSHELADIRSADDNEAAADFLLEQVRGITANPDTRLIVSIAGGRKTMGALLYACMTLVGREEDRLTHVLVSEPFESLRGFYFPGQPASGAGSANALAGNRPQDAHVELAEVPFVPLRNLFHRELGRAAGTFSNLVASCRAEVRHRAAEELRIEILTHRAVMRLNQSEIRLTAREHHLILCLASRAKRERQPLPAYADALAALAQHASEWNELIRSGKLPDKTPAAASFTDEHDIVRVLSDLRRKLRTLGQPGLILSAALPVRGRFSFDVPGPLISII